MQAPYKGAGQYSVDLTKLDPQAPLPTDGAAHQYSVALVGDGVIGQLSAAVSVTLPLPVVVVTTGQNPPPPVWPVAVSVATQTVGETL
jgi:hypothetical protein